jgi:hypothetical protein
MKTIALFAASLLLAAQLVTAADNAAAGFSGKVAETMNSGGYTYVLVDTGAQKLWATTSQFEVKVGDTVKVGPGMAMEKYHSKTLNRDFDTVYFTGEISVGGAAANGPTAAVKLPEGHPPIGNVAGKELPKDHPPVAGMTAKPKVEKVDLTGIKPVKNGKTVKEIYADKTKLAGKKVTLRGKVVKYNPDIMGKNWLHVQDGTGSPGENDLMVTTATAAKVGDTVLVGGIVTLNKDFGAGYKYDVILDDAEVAVE